MNFPIFNYMIKLGKNIKYIKYPCKKCLVKITCNQMSSCEMYKNHMAYDKYKKDVYEEFQELCFIACLFGGLGFTIVTVAFGLWKWGEIVYGYFA